MLSDQAYDGHSSVHDPDTAGQLGLVGAPIEGPTHFSQFDPLAWAMWGPAWFEQGCISAHFLSMAWEGDQIVASMTADGSYSHIVAESIDGVRVLDGTASVGSAEIESEAERRLRTAREPGELFILDAMTVGDRRATTAAVHAREPNGPLYPFSLDEKVAQMTEPSSWYTSDGGAHSPWGQTILPMELISVLAYKEGTGFEVRRPSVALFLDLEIRLVSGPVLADTLYRIDHQVVGLTTSRRVESYWVRSDISTRETGDLVASILLHTGFFKASFPGYPPDRLPDMCKG